MNGTTTKDTIFNFEKKYIVLQFPSNMIRTKKRGTIAVVAFKNIRECVDYKVWVTIGYKRAKVPPLRTDNFCKRNFKRNGCDPAQKELLDWGIRKLSSELNKKNCY